MEISEILVCQPHGIYAAGAMCTFLDSPYGHVSLSPDFSQPLSKPLASSHGLLMAPLTRMSCPQPSADEALHCIALHCIGLCPRLHFITMMVW
jgi:hypothetical protein